MPVMEQVTSLPPLPSQGDQVRMRREFVRAIAQSADIFSEFATTGIINTTVALRVLEQHQRHLADNIDVALSLATQPLADSYPVRHSVQSSLLAMAMGMDMGLNDEELLVLGFGTLSHDLGMLLMPARLLSAADITEKERIEITRHPQLSAEALDRSTGVPAVASTVAAQVHERLDGTGYPRGLTGVAIHRLSRIAMVSDAFLAMIAPRSYRAAHEPSLAAKELLFAAHRGRFDSAAVRSLIRIVSLYPIGSTVWLNDGRVARVVRSNRDAVDRPVVMALALHTERPVLEEVDLLQNTELSIARAGEVTGSQ